MPTRVRDPGPTSPPPLDGETVRAWAGVPTTIAADLFGDDGRLVVIPRAEAAALAMGVRAEEGWEARLERGETTLEVFKVPAAATTP